MQRHKIIYAFIAIATLLVGACTNDDTNDIISKYLLDVPSSLPIGGNDGAEAVLNIKGDCSWTISGTPNWVKLSAASGNGTTAVTITAVGANPNAETRTATLTVSASEGQLKQSVVLTQAKGEESLASVSQISFGCDGGEQDITINSNSSWTVSVSGAKDWITIDPASGSGQGSVTVTAAPNPNQAERTAEITIASTTSTATAKVTVKQEAREAVKIDKSQLSFAASGNSAQEVTFISTAAWYIKDWNADTDKASWLHFSPISGNAGSNVVKVTVDDNATTQQRSQTVIFTDGYSEATLTVSQTGNYLTIEGEASLTYDSEGGIQSFAVKSSVELKLSNVKIEYNDGDGWLKISGPTTNGDIYTYNVTAESLEQDQQRTAEIIVSSGSLPEIRISVAQGGKNYLALLTDANVSFESTGGSAQVTIWTNLETTMSLNYMTGGEGWLTISEGKADGENITYTVTAAENVNTQRTATLTFSNERVASVVVSLNQASAPLPETPTFSINGIQKYQFTANGSYRSQAPITEYGICVSDTYQTPTIDHAVATGKPSGNATQGTFALVASGLKSAHKYYVRIYVKNNVGISYSDVQTVTTAGTTPGSDDNNPPSTK